MFSLKGKIYRKQFWIGFVLGCMILLIGLLFTDTMIDPISGVAKPQFNFLSSIITLAGFWTFFVIQIKRFRDRGLSGWWIAIGLVPFGFIWIIYTLGFRASKSSA